MQSRGTYALIGLFVGAIVNVLYNLIAAAIQQRAFPIQFSNQSIWWLVGLAMGGLLLGFWLGDKVTIPVSAKASHPLGKPQTLTISRLRALLSYGKLRGRGIHLFDILLVGSKIDVDTRK